MLVFKKENGFPMTIMIETGDHESVHDDREVWRGYESIVTDENQNIISRFLHSDFRARVHWAKGFFSGIKLKELGDLEKKIEELFNYPDPWKGPETVLYDDDNSNLEVGDWIVRTDGKIQRIAFDDDPDLPWQKIARFATKGEAKNAAKINELLDDLKREKASNRSAWDTYGSELCAGDMIGQEKSIEDKIKELRDENL
jgi:hypothetical protein